MKRDLDAALLRLDDYVRGHGEGLDDERYEDDLFARAVAGEAPELRLRDALRGTFREMEARGTISPWITSADIARLRASGLRLQLAEVDPANPVALVLDDEAELLVTRVPLDLAGVRRLDVEITTPDGRLLKKMPDLSFDPRDGAVFACCEMELARATVAVRSVSHFHATTETGERRLLATIHM